MLGRWCNHAARSSSLPTILIAPVALVLLAGCAAETGDSPAEEVTTTAVSAETSSPVFAGPTATVETAASSSVGSGDVTEIEAGAIQAYAETFGIDPQQAELQLRQQELAAEFHRRLTEATGDWYAGVVFEHVPSFRVVVLRPTRAPRDLFENVAGAYESDLEIVYRDVEYTMEDLRARLDEAARVAAAVDGRCDSRSAVLVDEIRQLVIVQVERDDIENVGEAIQQLELRSPGPDVVVEARSMWDEPASSGG